MSEAMVGQHTDSGYTCSFAMMGTVVHLTIVGHGESAEQRREREAAAARAIDWFAHVESACSRFDAGSELRRLTLTTGVATHVSTTLLEAVRFALAVAERSDGAFDPTLGHRMEARGFDRAYQTGERTTSGVSAPADVTYRDVELDESKGTITLHRPLLLDLGAVAKGLAVDMAARELAPFRNFSIDAGGDVLVSGHNGHGEPWRVGIRHPRDSTALVTTVHLTSGAVCTSGDYARRMQPATSGDSEHHILDPVSGRSPTALASVSVRAGCAMVADALATAAFVLGPERGAAFLEAEGAPAFLVTPGLECIETAGWRDD